jgi:putative tricarboxylic transport membrane protein
MGKADRISGSFWFIFSVMVSIESYRLGLGTLHRPGPGFLFFWAGIFLGILSVVVIIRAWGSKKSGEPEISIFGGQNMTKVVFVLISLFFYALLMEKIGFIIITLLLFVFLLGVIEKKRWFFAIFVSILVTVIAYLIFEIWLKSQLPKGLLGFLRL